MHYKEDEFESFNALWHPKLKAYFGPNLQKGVRACLDC